MLIAPLMPGINDAPHQLEPLLQGAIDAGAKSIGGVALHLRGEVKDVFMEWLREQRPELVERYEELYRRGAYAPARGARAPGRAGTPVRPREPRGGLDRASRLAGAAARRDRSGRWSGLRPSAATEATAPPAAKQQSLF